MDTAFQVTILNTGESGVYDMVLELTVEPVSKNRYLKGYIYKNPTNESLVSTPLSLILQSVKLPSTKYDISQCFSPADLVNGYIPISKDLPSTILDDYERLTKELDKFFST